MKPSSEANEGRRGTDTDRSRGGMRFLIIDCHFQVFSLDRYRGGTGSSPSSFLNISREYFRREARRNFLAEAAFFLIIAAILSGALISGWRAISHFLHLPTA